MQIQHFDVKKLSEDYICNILGSNITFKEPLKVCVTFSSKDARFYSILLQLNVSDTLEEVRISSENVQYKVNALRTI